MQQRPRYVLVVQRCMSSSSRRRWDSGVLEKAAGEGLNEGTGDGAIESVELITEDESGVHSGGDESLLGVFLGRRVSAVILGLAEDSGGDGYMQVIFRTIQFAQGGPCSSHCSSCQLKLSELDWGQ
jgi:hypothetical protein